MTKISRSLSSAKRLFPAIYFGALTVFLASNVLGAKTSVLGIVFPLFMMVLGFFICKEHLWCLVDEVFDDEDKLIFRKGAKEQTIFLRDIININYEKGSAPVKVSVYSRSDGPLGRKLSFSPIEQKGLFSEFSDSPMILELIERVDRARNA